MILSLMYHRVNNGFYSNSISMLDSHFAYISKNYVTEFPDACEKFEFRTKLILVFDDATYDFYFYIYPLLVKYNLKAVLAIPTAYIKDEALINCFTRLAVNQDQQMTSAMERFCPFCTWGELRIMASSGYVQLASHGHKHFAFTKDCTDNIVMNDLIKSQELIKQKALVETSIFVYPYGKFTKKSRALVESFFKYSFAITAMYNFSSAEEIIYRIPADRLKFPAEPFFIYQKFLYTARLIKNLLCTFFVKVADCFVMSTK